MVNKVEYNYINFSNLPLGASTSKISPLKVIHVGWVYRPIVPLPVSTTPGLDKAVIETQIVPDAVSPTWSSAPEVRVVVEYPLVDVAEYQLTFLGAEYRHGDDADVTVVRFRFVVRQLTV